MIVTVFRYRLTEDLKDRTDYLEWAVKLNGIVSTLPGYVSHKRFIAEDGERCTIVEFADLDGHDAWARHPVHLQAKELGKKRFFAAYDIKVTSVAKALKRQC